MSIPIEGVVPQISNQEKNSVPSTETPLYTGGRLSRRGRRGNRFQNYLLAGLTLSSPLIAACGTAARAGDSPTVPEATAEAFTQANPDASTVNIPGGKVGLEPTSPPDPPKSPEERIEEIRNLQRQALEKGELKVPTAEEILQVGGEVQESKLFPGGERGLYVIIPAGKRITMPALVEGPIKRAARVNKTAVLVEIQVGNSLVDFVFPLNGELLVKPGQVASLGMPLYTITNDPNSEIQTSFEKDGSVSPAGTVVLISYIPVDTGSNIRKFGEISLGSLLKSSTGQLMTIPVAPSGGKG